MEFIAGFLLAVGLLTCVDKDVRLPEQRINEAVELNKQLKSIEMMHSIDDVSDIALEKLYEDIFPLLPSDMKKRAEGSGRQADLEEFMFAVRMLKENKEISSCSSLLLGLRDVCTDEQKASYLEKIANCRQTMMDFEKVIKS